jgi:hypothetical protein
VVFSAISATMATYNFSRTHDFVKCSNKARARAFARIRKMLGDAVTLEGVRLSGSHPLAIWSVLKPRASVTVNASVESGLMQDCVCINYLLIGRVGDPVVITEGLWTLEVPDHPIGRAIQRSGLLPDAIISEAHHNLLQLGYDQVPLEKGARFLVKAGAGGFICHMKCGQDVSLGGAHDIRARTDTWIADDMLFDNQVLLIGNGAPGHRLGDTVLLPVAMRKLAAVGGKVYVAATVSPGLPELIGAAKGLLS